MSVEVNNESGTQVDEERLGALARHVLSQMRIHPQAELSLLLVDEVTMAQLHEQWMDQPGPTDVLAFPMDELRPADEDSEPEPGLLGDVVLCPTVAERQAQQAGHDVLDEIDLLCAHGVLHLLGYDHDDPEEHRQMFALQTRLLAAWQGVRSEPGGQA
jgi:probable rRNA maturation factor